MGSKPNKTQPSESKAQPNQRLPGGHFDREGLSQGSAGGAVRPTRDAYQGPRPQGESK
jgi:hypothetical protein